MNDKNKRLLNGARDRTGRWAKVPVGDRGVAGDHFERLKSRVLTEHVAVEPDPELRDWLELAARESAALAWTTPYPLLVWPELWVEASEAARRRFERQKAIRRRDLPRHPERILAA